MMKTPFVKPADRDRTRTQAPACGTRRVARGRPRATMSGRRGLMRAGALAVAAALAALVLAGCGPLFPDVEDWIADSDKLARRFDERLEDLRQCLEEDGCGELLDSQESVFAMCSWVASRGELAPEGFEAAEWERFDGLCEGLEGVLAMPGDGGAAPHRGAAAGDGPHPRGHPRRHRTAGAGRGGAGRGLGARRRRCARSPRRVSGGERARTRERALGHETLARPHPETGREATARAVVGSRVHAARRPARVRPDSAGERVRDAGATCGAP